MQLLTHQIHYKDIHGDVSQAMLTRKEALVALEKWGEFKPVPIPQSNKDRTSEYLNPRSVLKVSTKYDLETMAIEYKKNPQKMINQGFALPETKALK